MNPMSPSGPFKALLHIFFWYTYFQSCTHAFRLILFGDAFWRIRFSTYGVCTIFVYFLATLFGVFWSTFFGVRFSAFAFRHYVGGCVHFSAYFGVNKMKIEGTWANLTLSQIVATLTNQITIITWNVLSFYKIIR